MKARIGMKAAAVMIRSGRAARIGVMTQAACDAYELPEGFEYCSKLNPVIEAVSALDRVKAVVRILHEPGGCPWDGSQTNRSLLKPLLEETYEYIDAVETDDRENMREELGDMLLQSVFQAQVCAHDETDPFGIDEVCDRLVDKLIIRHPHVFMPDDAVATESDAPKSAEETLQLWERMKQKEKQRKSVLYLTRPRRTAKSRQSRFTRRQISEPGPTRTGIHRRVAAVRYRPRPPVRRSDHRDTA